MFSELPKLFDRDFAIGFFLPVACFFSALYGLLVVFHHTDLIAPLKEANVLVGTTLLGLITWLAGVLLLAWNRPLYQLFEGYKWPLNTEYGKRREQSHFNNLLKQIDDAYITANRYKDKPVPNDLAQQQTDLLIIRAERFPYRKRDILPTKFGNTIRAFETYPKAMYGFDTIEGWFRLLAVVPKDYRQMIDSAKAQTDFWLNIWFLSYITMIVYIGLAIWSHHLTAFWSLGFVPIVVFFSRSAAITAAKEWGAIFKASFDVFLPELYVKLHLLPPSAIDPTSEKSPEWQIWDAFSTAIIYRDPSYLPQRMLGQKSSSQSEEKSSETSREAGEEEAKEDGGSSEASEEVEDDNGSSADE